MKRLFTIGMLLMAGQGAIAQNLQGGLETWRTYSSGTATNLEAPNGWFSADSLTYAYGPIASSTPQKQLTKSTSAHGGQYAAQITTRDLQGMIGVITGILTNAEIGFDLTTFIATGDPMAALSYSGGTNVSQRIGGITAWGKYTPSGNDTARMVIEALKNVGGNPDSVIGTGSARILASSSWTSVFANMSYINSSIVPDRIVVAFMSSGGTAPQNGSVLMVDDVNPVSVGINDLTAKEDRVVIYPNPARNILSIEAKENGNFTWEAYNLQGQRVARQDFSNKTTANISHLAAGVYTYRICDQYGVAVQRGKFNVIR